MDCNKEEAVRAKDIAEKKMEGKDFTGARRIALKAQQLFPDLENIAQILIVCDVHCSADKKLFCNEKDWYGILQIEQTADEATIKKQYRKFALQLHPDKNKFAGAEAAFKLIGEAQAVLLDRQKRAMHDRNRGSCHPRQNVYLNVNTGVQNHIRTNFMNLNPQHQQSWRSAQQGFNGGCSTFWTVCPVCSVRFQYYREVLNRTLHCKICTSPFIAYDMSVHGTSPPTYANQQPFGQPKDGLNNCAFKVDIGSQGNSHAGNVNTRPFEKKGPTSHVSGKLNEKRRRKQVVEISESSDSIGSTDSENDVVANEDGITGGQNHSTYREEHLCRSMWQKQQGSYKENVSDNDEDIITPSKQVKAGGSPCVAEEDLGKAAKMNVQNGSAADLKDQKKDEKQKHSVSPEEILHNRNEETKEVWGKAVGGSKKTAEVSEHYRGEHPRRSTRQKQQVSNKKNVSDNNEDIIMPSKRAKASGSPCVVEEDHGKAAKMNAQNGLAADLKDQKKDKEWKRSLSPEEILQNRIEETKEGQGKAVGGSKMMAEVSDHCTPDSGGQNHSIYREEHPCRSMRQKQQVSYKEDLSDDNKDIITPSKRAKASGSPCVAEEDLGKAAKMNVQNGKQKHSLSPEEVLQNRNEETKELEGKAVGGSKMMAEVSEHYTPDSASNGTEQPNVMVCPDAEFSDFDKDKKKDCFAVGQIWAVYDTKDGMPRFYALIKKVFSSGFKLQITWFEPDPNDKDEINWVNKQLPVACGKFGLSNSEMTEDHLMFSHQVLCENIGCNTFKVYPRKGETWALYKNWDIKWYNDVKSHQMYEYEFVEILSDYVEVEGVFVAYLAKLKGFVSLYSRVMKEGAHSVKIPSAELLRFSHRVPSFKMTGRERVGVPIGSCELDPASLPLDLEEIAVPKDLEAKVGHSPSGRHCKKDNLMERSKSTLNMEDNLISSASKSSSKLHSQVIEQRRIAETSKKHKVEELNNCTSGERGIGGSMVNKRRLQSQVCHLTPVAYRTRRSLVANQLMKPDRPSRSFREEDGRFGSLEKGSSGAGIQASEALDAKSTLSCSDHFGVDENTKLSQLEKSASKLSAVNNGTGTDTSDSLRRRSLRRLSSHDKGSRGLVGLSNPSVQSEDVGLSAARKRKMRTDARSVVRSRGNCHTQLPSYSASVRSSIDQRQKQMSDLNLERANSCDIPIIVDLNSEGKNDAASLYSSRSFEVTGSDESSRERFKSSDLASATPDRCKTPLNDASPVSMGDNYYKQSWNREHCREQRSSSATGLEFISPSKDSRKRKDMNDVRILYSQHLDEDIIKHHKKILARLGVSIATSIIDATHFIADQFVPTTNMLEAIASGKPVVTHLWIESCGQTNCLIDVKNYILRDAKKEKEFGFSMPVSLARATQHPLLEGRRVLVTPNTKPSKEIISSLVKAVQGEAIERIGRSSLKDDKIRDDLLILSCEEDYATCVPFIEKGAAVYSSELLINGIVTQKLEYERHRLFADRVKKTRSTIWLKGDGGTYRPVTKCK